MKHVFRALCVAAGLSAFLNAQPQEPPTKPAEPAVKEPNLVTVTGCLRKEASGRYTLAEEATEGGPRKTYRVSAAKGVDLKAHVGHKVELTGTKAGKEPTAKVVEKQDPSMLKVTSLKHISETCPTSK